MKLTLDFKGSGNMFPLNLASIFYRGVFLIEEKNEVGLRINRVFRSFCQQNKNGDDYSNAEPIELDFSGEASKVYLLRVSDDIISLCSSLIEALTKDMNGLEANSFLYIFFSNQIKIANDVKIKFIELNKYAQKMN